jgi:hypothetical protein
VYQERLSFGLKVGCIGKLDRCNDRKICGKLPVNKTAETPVTSTCLSANCLELKTDCMSYKLLHIVSAASYKHYMQVKWNIATKVRKFYDGEIEIVPFDIMLSRYFAVDFQF